jgi:tetratricopeptide (TPR) repeat protein
MPFVKKNHSQDTSPSSPFIGRTDEILFFVHNILRPAVPTHNILSISGQGGVGKSTLLDRLIAEAHDTSFKDYCLTAKVDERQTTPISIMEKLALQLHLTGKFEKALKQYKEALQKRQVERETLRDRLFESFPDVAGAVVEGIPVAGPLLREGARVATSHLLREHQALQVQQTTELLEIPVSDLTSAFVTELNHLADTNVTLSSTGQKRQRCIVLFFDTFEQLAVEATPWLLDHFLTTQISSNVVLVIAGRDSIEHTSPDDPKRWLPYCDDDIIYWISLNSFTEDETRTYLVKRGITDANHIANIWHLSRGLPLYLGLLTSNPHGDVDPTKDVVVNFLRWIPKHESIKRQLALDAALLSRPFNQDDLEAFSYVSESDRALLYQWLIEQPFVRSRSQDGRHMYHDVARDLFSLHLYQRSQKGYYEIRRALVTYYQKLLEKIQAERGKEAYHLEEWLELLLAVVLQLLLLPDQASYIKAIEYILHAYEGHTSNEQDTVIAKVLRDLAQESSAYHISSAARWTATQLFLYIEADLASPEGLAASEALLEKVAHAPSFPSELLADIYYRRGRAYNQIKSGFSNRELAIENYQQALKLFETTNYNKRGWAYFSSGNYREALACHNQVLEQNSQDADAYCGRGWAYNNLGEHQRAIDDFERVLELAPNYHNPEGLYNGLRWAYYETGKYQQALSANDHLLKQYPGDYDLHVFRCKCYLSLKEYQQAIEERNHVLELAPTRTEACVAVGWAYFYARSYSEALAYHNQALEQNSQDADAYHGRGWAYNNSGKYQQALDDFEHVLELAPNYHNPGGLYNGLRWAYYRTGKYQQALSANDHLLKQDFGDYDLYVFRARCFRSLQDYPQSIDSCNHALELAPEQADAYFQRGITYLWLKDLGHAQADFTRSCALKPTRIDVALLAVWAEMGQEVPDLPISERLEAIAQLDADDYVAHVAHICLGIALLLRRNWSEALAELEQALVPTRHEEWKVHFWIGMTYAFLGRDEDAVASIEKALELALPPILLAPLRWFAQERPDFYGKYAVPLIARFE